MNFIETSKPNRNQKKQVISLWNTEYPTNLKYASLNEFENYLMPLDDQHHIMVTDEKKNIKAWYVDFIRSKERWFVIIIDSDWQGKNLGTKLLNRAKVKHAKLNGWIIDHNNYKKADNDYYKSPKDFYLKNDFEILQDITLKTDKILAIKITWTK